MALMAIIFIFVWYFVRKQANELNNKQREDSKSHEFIIKQREDTIKKLGIVAFSFLFAINFNLFYSIWVYSFSDANCMLKNASK